MYFSKKVVVYNGVWGKDPTPGMFENFCVKILTVSHRKMGEQDVLVAPQ